MIHFSTCFKWTLQEVLFPQKIKIKVIVNNCPWSIYLWITNATPAALGRHIPLLHIDPAGHSASDWHPVGCKEGDARLLQGIWSHHYTGPSQGNIWKRGGADFLQNRCASPPLLFFLAIKTLKGAALVNYLSCAWLGGKYGIKQRMFISIVC